MGSVVNATRRQPYPQERPRINGTRGCVGPNDGLDGCGKYLSYRDSIPGPSSPQRVPILTTLFRPLQITAPE